jgi:GNAT superfamily N-acetyltransferase
MLETRMATETDAKLIMHHRRSMFADARVGDDVVLDAMAPDFERWVAKMIREEKYFGWFALDGGRVVAGVGLLLLDWPPHPFDPHSTQRGYLLNVYVEPEFRRRKLASQLLEFAMAEARRRKVRVIALHATDKGRPVYENIGFRATNEMIYVELADA